MTQMAQFPTADVVAAAIVAASRETGEDPVKCAAGEPRIQCRHYAAHALMRAFPDCPIETIGRLVGAKTQSFCKNSINEALKRRGLRWWDDDALDRVQRAVDAIIGGDEVEIPIKLKPPAAAPKVDHDDTEIRIDQSRGEIWFRGKAVILAGRMFDLVEIIVQARPKAVGRERLRNELYGDVGRGSKDVVLNSEARAAAGRLKMIGLQLTTIPKVGYVVKPMED